MGQIASFFQVRADGKEVPAGMAVGEMLALGWPPSKVVALTWTHGDVSVELAYTQGVHGIVVPGDSFVAAIVGNGNGSQLVVLSADGSVHGAMENVLAGPGGTEEGYYSWFEPTAIPGKDRFGAVFQTQSDRLLRCDIDAGAPKVLTVLPIRG